MNAKTSFPLILQAAILLTFAAALASCDRFSLYDVFTSQSQLAVEKSAKPLAISPSPAGVFIGGTLRFTANGGTSPYSFSVLQGSAGGIIGSSTGSYSAPTTAGNYTVQVTDAKGMISNAEVTVVGRPKLQIEPSKLRIAPSSEYQFSAIGGLRPYTFTILPATGAGTLQPDGSYTAPASVSGMTATITVTDALNKSSSASVTIGDTAAFAVSPGPSDFPSAGDLPAITAGNSVWLTPTGAVLPVGWTPTAGDGTISPDGPATIGYTPTTTGLNTVEATDAALASASVSFNVAPTPPTDLSANVMSGSEVDLSWVFNSAGGIVNGFNVERAVGNGSFTTLNTGLLPKTPTSYQDTTVTPGTVYVYRIQAVRNNPSLKSYSEEVIAVTP